MQCVIAKENWGTDYYDSVPTTVEIKQIQERVQAGTPNIKKI